jgi:general secretion pathway protein M
MMPLERMPLRDRRILALGLLLSLVLLFVMLVLVPMLQSVLRTQQGVGDAAFRVERLQGVIAQLPALERRVTALEAAVAAQDTVLHEPSEALAGAALQGLVSGMITRHGGQIQSIRLLPVKDAEAGLQRLALRVQFRGDSDTLALALAEMETLRPLLFIDLISIQAQREFRIVDGLRAAGYYGGFETQLEVAVFWRPGGGS